MEISILNYVSFRFPDKNYTILRRSLVSIDNKIMLKRRQQMNKAHLELDSDS